MATRKPPQAPAAAPAAPTAQPAADQPAEGAATPESDAGAAHDAAPPQPADATPQRRPRPMPLGAAAPPAGPPVAPGLTPQALRGYLVSLGDSKLVDLFDKSQAGDKDAEAELSGHLFRHQQALNASDFYWKDMKGGKHKPWEVD